MKKWIIRIVSVIAVVAVCLGGYSIYTLRSYGFLRSPVYETTPPEVPELSRPAVLVFSKTNSFIHKEAIPPAEQLFKNLGEKHGWSVYITENGAIHNPEDLTKFDTIIWNNVTGDVLTTEQQTAMISYIENGGGWIGIHGAGDSSSDWDWYENTLIGGQFIGHPFDPQFQVARMVVEKQNDPIMAHLGDEWIRTDEWYSYAESPRKVGKTILATLDESTYSPIDHLGKNLAMGEDHPIIWKDCIGRGRTVYSALGHTAESYSDPKYITLLAKSVLWTARLEGGDCRE